MLAALGPGMVALAAERTAGVYPYFTTEDHIRQMRGELGRSRSWQPICRWCWLLTSRWPD